MTVLLDFTANRTLTELLQRLSATPPAGPVEAWLFEDRPTRQAAEVALAERGITARIRSAYKPLVCFFLEEASPGASDIQIRYPVHPTARPARFWLEAYPLAGMLGGARLAATASTRDDLVYDVELDGILHEVFAPNRLHTDHCGDPQLSPTGWLRIPSQGVDEALFTDFEQLYDRAIAAIAGHDFGDAAPLFEELNLRVTLPARDEPLGVGDEVLSLTEAMHEDLYFSVMELFQARLGSGRADYHGRPGQIVPQVARAEAPPTIRVETRPLYTAEASVPFQPLSTATHPLGVEQIRTELAGLSGEPITAPTRAGRVLPGIYRPGTDKGVIITSGQHANETTGIIGALRAAQQLDTRPEAHFAVTPLENPDGYALHHRLRAEHPHHMHHAARYTGLGDDVESRGNDPVFESLIRREQLARMPARLHLNLHGYPSHEWTRPLSGYLPQGFELWTIPKGFFLIVRHHAGLEALADELVTRITERLVDVPGLVDYNRRQLALYTAHAGPPSAFRIINDFPVWTGSQFYHEMPLTLITEFPDETIYGEEFILGHNAQTATALAAYDIWQQIGE